MAYPDDPLSAVDQWGNLTDPPLDIDRARMTANVTDPLNAVADRATAMPQGLLGEVDGTGTVTLATASTNYVANNTSVTITLTQRRKLRVVASALYSSGTAVGLYRTHPAYNSGSSVAVGSAVTLGGGGYAPTTATGTNGRNSAAAERSVTLDPGTYTFYPVVRRHGNGSATDTADIGYIAVYDVGEG